MGNMEYVRKKGYPNAQRGYPVRTYLGDGTITSANSSGHILVRFQQQRHPVAFHPGDVEFLERRPRK